MHVDRQTAAIRNRIDASLEFLIMRGQFKTQMNKRTRDIHHGLRLTLLAAVLMTLLGTLALFAHGQSAPPTSATPSGSDRMLPSNATVPINVINRFFPEATQEVATG